MCRWMSLGSDNSCEEGNEGKQAFLYNLSWEISGDVETFSAKIDLNELLLTTVDLGFLTHPSKKQNL